MTMILKRLLPLFVFIISLALSYTCLNFRENDWITGGLLFTAIILPLLLIEIALLVTHYYSQNTKAKRLGMIGVYVIGAALLIMTIIYVFYYN